jgi:hypothetical protein
VLVLWRMLPGLGAAFRGKKMLSAEALAARQATPLELVGIDTPYPEAFGEHLDRELGLPARHRPVPRPVAATGDEAAVASMTPTTTGEGAHHVPV